MKALVFSSSHPADDPRVRRSVSALSRLGSVRVFLSEQNASPNDDGSGGGEPPIQPIPVGFTRILGLKLPQYRKWARTVRQAAGKVELIYVHESGMVGLLFGSYMKKISGGLFIFDYHDSLEYEIYYQLNKLGLAKKWLTRLYLSWIIRYLHAVDAVVGISPRQLSQLNGHVGKAIPALAIPNVRPFLESDYSPTTAEPELVYIGNVSRVNNIESLIGLLGHSTRVRRLKVFGSADQDYAIELQRLSARSIEFMGRYQHDLEIQTKLSGKPVCILTDAPDPLQTDLNEICSPNKVYSAINIGIPLLIHSRLENVADMILKFGAGNVYGDEDEFHRRLDEIIENYGAYRANVLALKRSLAETDYDDELTLFLQKLIAAPERAI